MKKNKSKNGLNAIKISGNLFVAEILAYPLILFVIFYIGCNLASFVLAFQKYISFEGKIKLVYNGFENFKSFIVAAFNQSSLGSYFKNSIIMYLVCLLICNPLYLIFSYQIFKKCFMYKSIRVILMVPQLLSGFVVGLLFSNFFGYDSGLSQICKLLGIPFRDFLWQKDTAFPLTIFYTIWLSFATNVIVYPNAMKEIGDDIFEAAEVDGINSMFKELYYIILPLLYPTFTTFIVLGFAGMLTNSGPLMEFYQTNAPEYVKNIGYYYFVQVLQGGLTNYPFLAAGGIIMTLIIGPLTLILKKLLEKYGPSNEV